MFKLLFRRTLPKNLSKYDINFFMLLKDLYKIHFITDFILLMWAIFPFATLLFTIFTIKHTWDNIIVGIILIIGYLSFLFWFLKKFNEPIKGFKKAIASLLYSSLYTFKGNAILYEDFEKIKEENKQLYFLLKTQNCRGYCYGICFEILKCLKQGEIKFVATRAPDYDDCKNYYTMHALYVNNNWCFDTYSCKQYPIDELLKTMEAKEYTTFSYSDIESKSYDDFRNANYLALEKWCKENNCEQEWKTPEKD